MITATKVKVSTSGSSQQITMPADFQFSADEVYVERNPHTGVVTISEKRPLPSMEELFALIEASKDEDWELDRDRSLPQEREFF